MLADVGVKRQSTKSINNNLEFIYVIGNCCPDTGGGRGMVVEFITNLSDELSNVKESEIPEEKLGEITLLILATLIGLVSISFPHDCIFILTMETLTSL